MIEASDVALTIVAITRQGLTNGERQHDAAKQHHAMHAAGTSGLDLPVRYREQAAANDLTGIGSGVQGQGQDGAPIGLAQEWPEDTMAYGGKLAEAIVDQEDLNQQRRTAEDEDIEAREPIEDGDAGKARKRQQQRQDGAEADRCHGKLDRQRERADETYEGLFKELPIHQRLLTPRDKRRSAC
jgi:hypothetical protein